MINISRTKFCVLNVAKSEIISHLKLSSADLDLKQTGQLFDLIRPRRVLTKLGKGRHQLTIAELDDFIKVHTKIPANPDTPYIVKSEMLPLGESPSNELYVNMSSQTIVNRLLKRPQIQVDFTYDVSVDNLMILMIGISNKGHEYLPISVVLTSPHWASTGGHITYFN